jgi:hypothetical protein
MKKPYLKREEFVYMDFELQMSDKAMANALYAAVITQASFPTIWSMSAHDYNRSQNKRNGMILKVHIHPTMIETFNSISLGILQKPPTITIN